MTTLSGPVRYQAQASPTSWLMTTLHDIVEHWQTGDQPRMCEHMPDATPWLLNAWSPQQLWCPRCAPLDPPPTGLCDRCHAAPATHFCSTVLGPVVFAAGLCFDCATLDGLT